MPYFDKVNRFTLFLAPARSGHSVLAHLLTAHRDVLISDELDAVKFFSEGYSAEQVYALIKYQDSRHQSRERRKSGYDYAVAASYQADAAKHPSVIGDAKGNETTTRLGQNPGLLGELRTKVQVPLRCFVQARNPFDMIATKIRRRQKDTDHLIDSFENFVQSLNATRALLSYEEMLPLNQEDILNEPEHHLTTMFEFLNVEPDRDIVAKCASKLWSRPHQTRNTVQWTPEQIDRVVGLIGDDPLFRCYVDAVPGQ